MTSYFNVVDNHHKKRKKKEKRKTNKDEMVCYCYLTAAKNAIVKAAFEL